MTSTIEQLRAEFKALASQSAFTTVKVFAESLIVDGFCYEDSTPEQWVAAAKKHIDWTNQMRARLNMPVSSSVDCWKCTGTGKFWFHSEHGRRSEVCFACQGKGHQTPEDVKRCSAWARNNGGHSELR